MRYCVNTAAAGNGNRWLGPVPNMHCNIDGVRLWEMAGYRAGVEGALRTMMLSTGSKVLTN